MIAFKTYGVCACGNRQEAAFGNLWFVSHDVCWDCGRPNSQRTEQVARWVPTGKLFRPSTWGSGYWQEPTT